MMKRWLHILLFMFLTVAAVPVQAFWGLAIDPYPMPDFIDEAVTFLRSAASLSNNTQKVIKTGVDNVNNLKVAAQSLFEGDLSTLVSAANINPGQKKAEVCVYKGHRYKNTSDKQVYKLTKAILLQYPGKSELERQAFEARREKFYRETVVEVFTAAELLKQDLDNRIKPRVDATIKCVTGDSQSCGNSSANGNNDAINAEGDAWSAVEDLYTTLLKVTALRAQLVAAQAIYRSTPSAYVDGVAEQSVISKTDDEEENSATEEQTQAALPLGRVYASASTHQSSSLVFAQIGLADNPKTAVSSALSRVESVASGVDRKVDDAFMFVTPPSAPLAHPYVYEADKMAELEKLSPIESIVNTATEVHNQIHRLSDYRDAAKSLDEMRQRYEKALNALRIADDCAQKYLARHFDNPQTIWGAKGDITDYDSRDGVSGWAFHTYETAKAKQTADAGDDTSAAQASIASSSGNIVSPDVDYESVDLDTPSQANEKVVQSEKFSVSGSTKEEKASEESRQTQMMIWQIGSNASKLLASDYKVWKGQPKTAAPFPVWQDVKAFYDQYLKLKYENIKQYLNSVSSNDILALAAARIQQDNAVSYDLLQKKDKILAAAEQNIEKIMADSELPKEDDGGLARLKKERKAIAAQIDKASDLLKQYSDELADLRNKSQDDAGTAMRDEVTAREEFPDSLEGTPTGKTPKLTVDKSDAQSDKFKNAIAANKKDLGTAAMEVKVAAQKAKIVSLEQELKAKDKKIWEVNRDNAMPNFIKRYKARQEARLSKLRKIAEARDITNENNQAASEYQNEVKMTLLKILPDKVKLPKKRKNAALLQIYNLLDQSAKEKLKTELLMAMKTVDDAYDEIKALGEGKDDLYNPELYSQIKEIHQNMINTLKAQTVTITAGNVLTVSQIPVFVKLMTGDTSPETEDYFVGSSGKFRDMKAPKAIFAQNLPPVREAFHFDEVDFENVLSANEGNTEEDINDENDKNFDKLEYKDSEHNRTIKAENFLKVGGDIPPVWRYMLRDKAFVERDIDLNQLFPDIKEFEAILESKESTPKEKENAKKRIDDYDHCLDVTFLRGGYMPCRIKGTSYSLDINKNGEIIELHDGNANERVECPYIERRMFTTGGAPGMKPYSTLRKVKLDIKDGGNVLANCVSSELGTLLEAKTDGTLQIREPVFKAFYYILFEKRNSGNLNKRNSKLRKRKEEKLSKYLVKYDRAPMSSNQIGEFLTYSENERNIRDQLKETQDQYDEMMAKLFEQLREYGYEPADNLNMAKDSDYNLVRSKLDAIKNLNVSEALLQIADVDVKENDVVAERIDNLKKVLAALQKDKDEETIISGMVEDQNDLDSEIKSTRINNSAVDNYVKKTKDDSSANETIADIPYCAAY